MILKEDFYHDIVYLDNAATTLKPRVVVDEYIRSFYETTLFKKYRARIAAFLNVEPETIKFTRGTTHSLNLIAKHFRGRVKRVTLPISAHHSNMLPWREIADVEYIPLNEKGELLKTMADFLAIDHVSNVLGTINEIPKAPIVVVDGAQAVSHFKVDLKKIDCDFYTFSGHKIYGPTGIGVLYDRADLIREDFTNFRAISSLATALDYFEEHIELLERENILSKYLINKLQEMGAIIYGTSEKRAPIISFSIEGLHPHDLASFLGERGIAIRAGNHCAHPLMEYLGIAATSRLSLGIYNDDEDVERFLTSLREAMRFFRVRA